CHTSFPPKTSPEVSGIDVGVPGNGVCAGARGVRSSARGLAAFGSSRTPFAAVMAREATAPIDFWAASFRSAPQRGHHAGRFSPGGTATMYGHFWHWIGIPHLPWKPSIDWRDKGLSTRQMPCPEVPMMSQAICPQLLRNRSVLGVDQAFYLLSE